MTYTLDGLQTLTAGLLVLLLGNYLLKRLPILQRNNIPAALCGGLLFSLALAFSSAHGYQFQFDMGLRDQLLLAFFSTVGLSARAAMLRSGGRPLAIILVAVVVLLVMQNMAGVTGALLFNDNPAYGLMAGSISFAGGHGTAIAWGQESVLAGLKGASELGIAAATLGLAMGGLLGGPICRWLMHRANVQVPNHPASFHASETKPKTTPASSVSVKAILETLLIIVVSMQVGGYVNDLLAAQGLKLPGFLTAMFASIVIANTTGISRIKLHADIVNRVGEISLHLFLAMSLMAMDLLGLMGMAKMLIVMLMLQAAIITLMAVILFWLLGKTYDACVMVGGFVGFGLGATPVAIANMRAVTERFGPSPNAYLIIPMVGAFFIDIANALVIKSFLALNMMHTVPLG